MPQLKPCPFCGGRAELETGDTMLRWRAYIHCTKCGSIGRIVFEGNAVAFVNTPSKYISKDDALEKAMSSWNQRAEEGRIYEVAQ